MKPKPGTEHLPEYPVAVSYVESVLSGINPVNDLETCRAVDKVYGLSVWIDLNGMRADNCTD